MNDGRSDTRAPESTVGSQGSSEPAEQLRLAQCSIDRAGDAVYWFDPAGRLVYVNEAAGRMLGYSVQELRGMSVADIDPEVAPEAWPKIWDRIKRRGAYTFEARHRARSGALIPVEVSIYHLTYGARELACSFVRDITERRRADSDLRAAKEEADRANAAKTRFLAAASHDLRQPLHAMELLVTVLSAKARDQETRAIIADIEESLGFTQRLLDALLGVSELEAGTVIPELQDVAVAPLLRRMQRQYALIAEEKGLDLRTVPSSAVVYSDPALLERILDNLVSNAVRYTDQGRVLLGCRRAGDRLRIEVWDTGTGIPPEQRAAVFEDFCQLDTAARERGAGLGLGLGIVRRLADLLDHRVEVASTPGRGSVFWVDAERLSGAAAPASAGASREPAAAPRAGATILVIEDDTMVLDAMRHVLDGWGYRVTTAFTARAALESLSAGDADPDLIIADYCLPGGETGVAAIEALRDRAGRALPAIIVTGDIASASMRDLSQSGFHVLRKPVRPAKLRALLRHLLDDRTATAEPPAPA